MFSRKGPDVSESLPWIGNLASTQRERMYLKPEASSFMLVLVC